MAQSSKSSEQNELSLPKAAEFKFVRHVDPKSPSRAAVHLLAAYAADAADFLHNGRGSRSVESLVSARKFCEYLVNYVSIRDNIAPPRTGEDSRPSFAGRVDNLKLAIPDFPAAELKRIWRDASDAAHPPEGISEDDIENYKNAYRIRATDVLKDALKVGLWFKGQCGMQSWFSRMVSWFRGSSK